MKRLIQYAAAVFLLPTLFALALSVVNTAPASATPTANPTLEGEELRAEYNQVVVTQADCDPSAATVQFETSGVATGPYPGTFTSHATAVMGPEAGSPGSIRDITSLDVQFSIDSPAGQVTGTKELQVPASPPLGICVEDEPSFANVFANAYTRYTATIDTGSGTFSDFGESSYVALRLVVGGNLVDNGPSRMNFNDSKAPQPPAIAVDPNADLADGDAVQVTGTGFQPGDVSVFQCVSNVQAPPSGNAPCDINGAVHATADAAGNFTTDITVHNPMTSNVSTTEQQYDCAAVACQITAFQNGPPQVFANAGLTFTALPPPPPTHTFTGFQAPIDNAPAVNQAKAGQTIPVKWRITDSNGVGVSDPATFVSVTSGNTACVSNAPLDAIETYSGSSGLQYLGDGNWQFNWKTPKNYAGQCRVMQLNLADGIGNPTANFQFK